jgi:hypothetical protein
MKRRITVDQLNDLTEEQKHRLDNCYKPNNGDTVYHIAMKKNLIVNNYNEITGIFNTIEECKTKGYGIEWCLPLLDIHQMIELLTAKEGFPNLYISNYPGVSTWGLTYICNPNIEVETEPTELCDALWSAVKQVL